MVGCGEENKGYKLFDTSTFKTFFERSVKFEEEPIPDFELAPGECSSPQPFEYVSDDTRFVFSDMSDINMSEYYIVVYYSPSSPKWDEKVIQAAGELGGNPHEPMKTRSQTGSASFGSYSVIAKKCYILVGSDPLQAFNSQIWKSAMEK